MKAIAILTTILLQSVRAMRHNVFDTEPFVATNFLPFDDVARPGSLTVYDNEGNMHVVANDENFRPASDGELLVVDNDENSDVTKDENFLPPDVQIDDTSSVVANDENFRPASDGELLVVDNNENYVVANDENFLPPDDIVELDATSSVVANDENFLPSLADTKYFQIHSLYKVDDTQVCLQPRSKKQGSTIVVRPCLDDSSRSLQWWTVDEFGQFRNKADSDLCMTKAPESKLKLKPCLERVSTAKAATSSFIYNYFTNQIHFTRNPLRIVTVPNNLDESNIVLLVKPNTENVRVAASVENKVTKWAVKFL
jgi:hypothetical protein